MKISPVDPETIGFQAIIKNKEKKKFTQAGKFAEWAKQVTGRRKRQKLSVLNEGQTWLTSERFT